jgi:hypothetical protein
MTTAAASVRRLTPLLLQRCGTPPDASACLQQRFASGSSSSGGSASSSGGPPAPAPRGAPAPAPAVVEVPLPPEMLGPWKRVRDKATGQHYYWNSGTGVTTPLGAPRPDAWVGVRTPGGGLYYHNRDDDSTTAVGEPLPGLEGRVAARQPQLASPGRGSAAFQLVGYPLAVGLGFGLIAGALRMLF